MTNAAGWKDLPRFYAFSLLAGCGEDNVHN